MFHFFRHDYEEVEKEPTGRIIVTIEKAFIYLQCHHF